MATYDPIAKFYDLAFAPAERTFLSRWRKETLSFLPETGNVLEVGCGTGANFSLYPQSWEAYSSDLSMQMLNRAATKSKKSRLLQANVEQLPFAENSFDAAFATLVFCSVPDPIKGFHELRRVIKRGGTLVLLEHVRPPGRLGRIFDIATHATEFLLDDHFNRETSKIVAKAGFRVLDIYKKARGVVEIINCINQKPSNEQ